MKVIESHRFSPFKQHLIYERILIAICLMGTVTSCQSQNLGNILKQANDVLANASKEVLLQMR
jgi:hypothetical protein